MPLETKNKAQDSGNSSYNQQVKFRRKQEGGEREEKKKDTAERSDFPKSFL
jgi:hypothetical protein